MGLVVVSFQESQLANDFAKELQVPFVEMRSGFFADTEAYVDLENPALIMNANVFFVHQFFFNCSYCAGSINDQLAKFLIACDLLKKMGAKSISAVVPYLAYSRQEKSFFGKFTGPIELYGRFFKNVGLDRVFTCDLHSEEIFDIFDVKLEETSLDWFWSEHLRANFKEEIIKNQICIASPDKGGLSRANKIAQILNVPVVWVKKERIGPDNPVALSLSGDVKSKVVVIIDDIIDTGRTAIQASQLLRSHGATRVIGVFTHAIFSLGYANNISESAFDKVFISDSLPVLLENSDEKISVCSINKYLIHNISQKLS